MKNRFFLYSCSSLEWLIGSTPIRSTNEKKGLQILHGVIDTGLKNHLVFFPEHHKRIIIIIIKKKTKEPIFDDFEDS